MSYASAVAGAYSGGGYAAEALDIYAGSASTALWAGWRLSLITDANGNLTPGQVTYLSSPVIGDSINISLSGPVTPNTSIAAAQLYLDTPAGLRVFTVQGTISLDGSSGTYTVSFHITHAQTAALTGGTPYQWSVVLTAASGDTWTPVDGATFRPRLDLAV